MKNTGNIALVITVLFAVYILVDKKFNDRTKKVGVVQMDKLIYDFKGMKEASVKYQEKVKHWGNQSDSLENRLSNLVDEIKLDSINRDHKKLESDMKKFMFFRQSYLEYTERLEQNSQKEDQQMTLGVINQLNEYIKLYANQEAYDLILSNTQQTSVSYCKEEIDVTQEVLDFANKKYEGIKE